ncbi:hypothetical protein KKF34_05680 [Myxococcota bacterium]|nr:hypothetical protein [Myxococcota bacterium]MBU1382298.1 hypothetical protein [Myxococcota bacterium]MBU1496352.1 hypothetical protein [Myxococcota bacterium]
MTSSEPQNIVLEKVTELASSGFSGLVRIFLSDEQIGVIIYRGGEVAWAVSKFQKEHLGSFLQRLGQVTQEQLQEVQRQYVSLAKTRKFGALLEELGFLNRSQLKYFLKLHIRNAILTLMDVSEATVDVSGGELKVDEDLTFGIQEILPEFFEYSLSVDEDSEDEGSLFYRDNPGSLIIPELFKDLSSIPGFRYALLIDNNGGILAMDVSMEHSVEITELPVQWIRSLFRVTRRINPGKLDFLNIETESANCILKAVDESDRYFLFTFFNPESKTGIIRHRIMNSIPDIIGFICGRTGDHYLEN